MEKLHAGEGYYQLWAVVNGAPLSLGKFNMDDDGVSIDNAVTGMKFPNNTIPTNFDLSQATYLWLTAEPQSESLTDTIPGYHMLAGPISGNAASLVYSDPNGMGVNFSSSTGSFILTTPTTASDHSDWDSGVWFMTSISNPRASLNVPTLPTGTYGWQYQGWIADNASADPTPYSTGEITGIAAPDRDLGGCGGSDTPPPFPGQDYLYSVGIGDCAYYPVRPHLTDDSQGGWSVVLTVEPSPNTGPNPFGFKPLQTSLISSSLTEGVSQALVNTTSTLPRVQAVINVITAVQPTTWGGVKALYR
jgi:hypothetical protein